MSEATIAKKAELVDVVAQKFADASGIVVADSRGLTVGQDTELRKQLREAGVEFKVIKNSILRRAAEKAGYADLTDQFVGPSAIAFSNEDAIAPAKILSDFAKTADALEVKAGVIEGKVSSKEEIVAIASLPNREGLLSMHQFAMSHTLSKLLQTKQKKQHNFSKCFIEAFKKIDTCYLNARKSHLNLAY